MKRLHQEFAVGGMGSRERFARQQSSAPILFCLLLRQLCPVLKVGQSVIPLALRGLDTAVPLSAGKRTRCGRALMSAFDPKRTSRRMLEWPPRAKL